MKRKAIFTISFSGNVHILLIFRPKFLRSLETKKPIKVNKLYILNQFQQLNQKELYYEWLLNFRKRVHHYENYIKTFRPLTHSLINVNKKFIINLV